MLPNLLDHDAEVKKLPHKNRKGKQLALQIAQLRSKKQKQAKLLSSQQAQARKLCVPFKYFAAQHPNQQTATKDRRPGFSVAKDNNSNNNNHDHALKRLHLSGAHPIRNIAVVAHVDHGKTTLTDALLFKAGLLNADRAGEQRSMDTLQIEKDRGITVKSTAISLDLTADWRVLRHSKAGEALKQKQWQWNEQDNKQHGKTLDDESEEATEHIYIGKFPASVTTAEDLQVILNHHGVNVHLSMIDFHGRRGYAMLTIPKSSAATLLGLNGKLRVDGYILTMEPSGLDAMSRLKLLCQEARRDMPTITVLKEENENVNVVRYTGLAEWPSLGGVMIQSATQQPSQARARQDVARECIAFLEAQYGDFQEPTDAREDDVADSGKEHDDMIVNDAAVFGDKAPLKLNLIDCPGHIDFNGEVTAALRLCDGALVVVDAVEGKAVQTDNVLLQALKEGVRPVLMLNKVDRLIVDKQLDAEELYDSMARVVDEINAFIRQHQLEDLPDQRVRWEDGSICFGSGSVGWSASVDSFVSKPESPDTVSSETAEQYHARRKAIAKRENFIKHIIKPVIRLHRLCGVLPLKKTSVSASERIELLSAFLSKAMSKTYKIPMTVINEENPKKLLKKVMMAWLPAADALTNMLASNAPSPAEAQAWRAALLYTGDTTDPSFRGIQDCDPSAPTTVYVSKMLPSSLVGGKNLVAYGRIFSGSVRVGDSLYAITSDRENLRQAKVSKVMTCGLGGKMHPVSSAEAGQLVAIEGVDKALCKAGTLSSDQGSSPIKHMDFSVTPVVQHSVSPKDKHMLTKMVAGMQQVVNADSTAAFFRDVETDQYIIAGAGELHIEILISTLRQTTGIEVLLSEPLVSYRETVKEESSGPALAKTDNKHNRMWIKASPLAKDIVEAMAKGSLRGLGVRAVGKRLSESYGWTASEASRIWAVGPEVMSQSNAEADHATCLLVDGTFGLQIPDDARANIVGAFQQVVSQGILVGAPLHGVRFELVDAKFHADSMHRRSVMPAASRACKGAVLLANPGLLEPVFRAVVTGAPGTLSKTFSVLGSRGGQIVDSSSTIAGERIEAMLPVRRSFGLMNELHDETKGHAQCSVSFDSMQAVPDQDQDAIVTATRAKKKLPAKLPTVELFVDKL